MPAAHFAPNRAPGARSAARWIGSGRRRNRWLQATAARAVCLFAGAQTLAARAIDSPSARLDHMAHGAGTMGRRARAHKPAPLRRRSDAAVCRRTGRPRGRI